MAVRQKLEGAFASVLKQSQHEKMRLLMLARMKRVIIDAVANAAAVSATASMTAASTIKAPISLGAAPENPCDGFSGARAPRA